ncbi:MAG: hypothetical protein AB7G39_07370 [Alphaproteobacteria bacterium]
MRWLPIAFGIALVSVPALAAEPQLGGIRPGMSVAEAEAALKSWGEKQTAPVRLERYSREMPAPDGRKLSYLVKMQAEVHHDAPTDGFVDETRTIFFAPAGAGAQQVVAVMRDLRAGHPPRTMTVAQMRADLQSEYGPQGVNSASGSWLVQDWHFERTAASNGPDRIRECSVARSGEQFKYHAGCGIAVRAEMQPAGGGTIRTEREQETAPVGRLTVTLQDHGLGLHAIQSYGQALNADEGWVANALRRADPTIVTRPE